jgi:hypothetical protein
MAIRKAQRLNIANEFLRELRSIKRQDSQFTVILD